MKAIPRVREVDVCNVREVLRHASTDWSKMPNWLIRWYELERVVFTATHIHIRTDQGTIVGDANVFCWLTFDGCGFEALNDQQFHQKYEILSPLLNAKDPQSV